MKTISRAQARENLERVIKENRLIQGAWSEEQEGRHLGCLLHALGNGVLNIQGSNQCPTNIIPRWLAEWTPEIFDELYSGNIYRAARSFSRMLDNAINYKDKDWKRLEENFHTWLQIGSIKTEYLNDSSLSKPAKKIVRQVITLLEEYNIANGQRAKNKVMERIEATLDRAAEEGLYIDDVMTDDVHRLAYSLVNEEKYNGLSQFRKLENLTKK